MKQFFKGILKQAILLAFLGLVLFGLRVFAFTPPTASPPDGEAIAPLNTGNSDQIKLGGLSVRGLLEGLGGLRIAGVTRLNVGSLPNDTGLVVQKNTVLGAAGETDATDKTLEVRGSTRTGAAYITDAADCNTGLTTQSDGKVVCNNNSFSYDAFCNTAITGIGAQEVVTLSMIKNGRNVCVDKVGCSYRVWAYDAGGIKGALGNFAIVFMQQPPSGGSGSGGGLLSGIADAINAALNSPNTWFDARGNTAGKNGAIEGEGKDKIQGWPGGPNFKMYDDYNNYNGFSFVDNNRDTLVIEDSDSARGFAVTLCDF